MRHPILVVDDNESNLELIESMFEAENYLVKTAKDAEEALKVLETFEPGANSDGHTVAGNGRTGINPAVQT
jgi:CheY-like chemotaxis protein